MSEETGKTSVGGAIAGFVVKSIAFLVMLTIPLLGVWSASSLAAYWNGPIALTIVVGLLAFPVLPLAWDLWRERARAVRERDSKTKPRPRILTFVDRMILRTLVLDGAFLAVLFVAWPQSIFTALSTRGDWFLDGVEGAEGARRAVLGVADGMEWLYELAHENPYADESVEDDDADEDLTAGVVETGGEGATSAATDDADAGVAEDAGISSDGGIASDAGESGDAGPAPDAGPTPDAGESSDPIDVADAGASEATQPQPSATPGAAPRWPLEERVHPAITAMTAQDERSIESVGAYIRAHASSELDRAKAVHDYVATRVSYDVPALTGHRPPQDSDTVFRTHMGVCEGYARLFHSLAGEVGLTSRYLVGDARDAGDPAEGEPHAWNAVQIGDAWYLLDPTWDSGGLRNGAFEAHYSTLYFLTPPDVFVASHFPDNRGWQLRTTPISRGEFHRQPILSPRFRAEGFELVAPDRVQVETHGAFEATVRRPAGVFVVATFLPHGASEQGEDCDVRGGTDLHIRCTLGAPGTYDVRLFSSHQEYGSYAFVGSFQAVYR